MNPVLNLPAPHTGIDFMAYAKGQELARDMNWRDELQREKRMQLYDRMDAADQNRQAVAYLATLQGNLQDAVSAGMSPTDFLTAQMQQIRDDPNFQSYSPEVQSKIIFAMSESAKNHMAGLQRAGMTPEANRLAQAFGITAPTSPVDIALQTGDVGQITQALQQQFGHNLQVSEDGQFATIAGQQVPLAHVLQTLARYQLPGSLAAPAAEAYNLADAEARQQRALAEQQALVDKQLEAYRQMYPAGGIQPTAQGQPYGLPAPAGLGDGTTLQAPMVTPQQAILGQAFGQMPQQPALAAAVPQAQVQASSAPEISQELLNLLVSGQPIPRQQAPVANPLATQGASWRDAFPLP